MKLSMRYLILCLLSLNLLSFNVWAENFRVDDIRIEGLQRVSANTIFSTLPIKVNTDVSTSQLQDAARAVFKTGFFSDIDIAREGNVLIINVVERPAINRIGVTGNTVLETEPLLEGLKRIGLSEGDIFKQSLLEVTERELNAQYSAIGRYATQVKIKVIELSQNQVNIAIKIIEGKVASIKHINVVGNKVFSENDLQFLFEIKTTGTWSWITGSPAKSISSTV
jgi:outer membrane protein insertion porin family